VGQKPGFTGRGVKKSDRALSSLLTESKDLSTTWSLCHFFSPAPGAVTSRLFYSRERKNKKTFLFSSLRFCANFLSEKLYSRLSPVRKTEGEVFFLAWEQKKMKENKEGNTY
jgi:hypothetical protein